MSKAVLVLACCVVAGGQVQACGLCHAFTGNPLSLPHPRALEIAVATRSAMDKGLLRISLEGSTSTNGWNKRHKLSGADVVQAWVERLNASSAAGPGPWAMHLVLIDTGETWTIYHRSGRTWHEARPGGKGDTALATTVPLLRAVVAAEMNWSQAIKQGLVVVDGKEVWTLLSLK